MYIIGVMEIFFVDDIYIFFLFYSRYERKNDDRRDDSRLKRDRYGDDRLERGDRDKGDFFGRLDYDRDRRSGVFIDRR